MKQKMSLVTLLLAIVVIPFLRVEIAAYILQEALVGLGAIVALLVLCLLFIVVFVLLWNGAHWLRGLARRVMGAREHRLAK